MTRIAFVTYQDVPQITADDQLAVALLATRGVEVVAAVWSDPEVKWSELDLVIIRSTWDYFKRPGEFAGWLDRLEREQVKVWNPFGLLRWNSDKRYLTELAAAGIPTLPARQIKQGESPRLLQLLEEENWDDAVVKPSISGGAFRTFRVDRATAAGREAELAEILRDGDALVQSFQREVVDPGEVSLIFFNQEFSHAVLKTPARGDFRCQPQFGATSKPLLPSPGLLREASAALAAAKFPTLYGRVDGVVVDGQFRLMELEVLEPSLSLASHPDAAQRFADAIMKALHKS